MGFKKITDQDLKYLIEKAESYIDVRDFGQALKYYDQIMGNIPPHPHFFKRRAFCYRMLENMDKAIADYNEALKLDPDDGVTYWERGACYYDIMTSHSSRKLLMKTKGELYWKKH